MATKKKTLFAAAVLGKAPLVLEETHRQTMERFYQKKIGDQGDQGDKGGKGDEEDKGDKEDKRDKGDKGDQVEPSSLTSQGDEFDEESQFD